MIIYKNVFEKMKNAGYSTAAIRKEKLIPEGTMQNIRDGKLVNLKTIDTICRLSGCKIEELIEYIPDENTQKNV
ncbi:helix-turn-helix domain-containing protein [Qiania dongpingensis]|uniref:Helix-turn-helix transcriptional regulator n=1 Tax=Qiania dongpingensis TaxID=2763669 RepID=A0A7G9G6X4_9FIRM|nr:helix-turn-helix transcriptional regulator [Qiania dongpingensis]QNM06556.1 helix-turn-helix transcriptional regulator [Qiania dongpingensis]